MTRRRARRTRRSSTSKGRPRRFRSTTRRCPRWPRSVSVRLLGVVPARARPLGSAVRRLRQLGAGDHRPVHRVGAREVAAELTAHAPASARLRGKRPGALERAGGALHADGRAGEHQDRQLHDCGAVLPRYPPSGAPPKPRPLVLLTRRACCDCAGHIGPEAPREGSFRPILDDPTLDEEGRRRTRRLVLCSGKIYYDIVGHEGHDASEGVAVARLEQLYPFPLAAYDELLSRYPNVTEVVWAQEEPQNMGPGAPSGTGSRRDCRPRSSFATSGGRGVRARARYPTAHLIEQDRIARECLERY